MFNIVMAHIDYFQDYMLSKPSWISFLLTVKIFKDNENLLANMTFPYNLKSYTDQVQCLSHSRDQ